jgi:ankyrin repeat protein
VAHFAALKADTDFDVYRQLCDYGVSFDQPDNEGWTPVCYAALTGQISSLRLCWTNGLLESGDVWDRENSPETDLDCADRGSGRWSDTCDQIFAG